MLRKLLVVSLVLLGWTSLGAVARAEEKSKKPVRHRKAPYVHCVIFHLKKDAPSGEKEALIADAHKLLARISSVRALWSGGPAAIATPKYASKFDVGLLVLFDDAQGLKSYLVDPLHLEFVKKHLKHLDEKQMGVFDFINQKAKASAKPEK